MYDERSNENPTPTPAINFEVVEGETYKALVIEISPALGADGKPNLLANGKKANSVAQIRSENGSRGPICFFDCPPSGIAEQQVIFLRINRVIYKNGRTFCFGRLVSDDRAN